MTVLEDIAQAVWDAEVRITQLESIEYPDPIRYGEFIKAAPADCAYCGGRFTRVNSRGGNECSGCGASR